MFLTVVGCGVVEPIRDLPDAPPSPDASPDAGCDPTPRRIEGVIVVNRMGTCCGGVEGALVDGSGLAADGSHDCAGANAWIGAQGSGAIELDLGAVYAISEIRIWNHGALAGGRGADRVEMRRSLDNRTLLALPGAPTALTRATTCPVLPQAFGAGGAPARFLHIDILGAHDPTTTPGIAEIEVIGARSCDTPPASR